MVGLRLLLHLLLVLLVVVVVPPAVVLLVEVVVAEGYEFQVRMSLLSVGVIVPVFETLGSLASQGFMVAVVAAAVVLLPVDLLRGLPVRELRLQVLPLPLPLVLLLQVPLLLSRQDRGQ